MGIHDNGYRHDQRQNGLETVDQTASIEHGDSSSLVRNSKENPYSSSITPLDVENGHSQFIFTAAHPVDARPSSNDITSRTLSNGLNPRKSVSSDPATVHQETAPLSLGAPPQELPSSELESIPKFGSGAHASVRMVSDSLPRPSPRAQSVEEQQSDDAVDAPSNGKKERFKREKVDMDGGGGKKAGYCLVRNEYGDVKLQKVAMPKGAGHSRNNTGSSFTGTFTLPQYPNIMTANDDEEHRIIMQTHDLMQVPMKKRLSHLDSNQKEVMQVYEGNESENIKKQQETEAVRSDDNERC